MIKTIFISMIYFISNVSFAATFDEVADDPDAIKIIPQSGSQYQFGMMSDVIYSNGPLINSIGTGVGNADESILQDLSLGLTTLGIGHQQSAGLRVSDEFTVERDGQYISTIEFFAYQTNEQASTITEINLRIWNGPPGQTGSEVIFGDTTTNVMVNTQFSGILRVAELDSGASNNRQITVSSVFINFTFDAGTYWLDWQSAGSGSSGPWAPPITIEGVANTGNALRSLDNGITYEPVLDAGLNTPMGLPFILRGTLPPPAVVDSTGKFSIILLMLLILVFGQLNYQWVKTNRHL